MTEPDPGHPIVLDSSVLVAYERVKSPGAAMHEAQSWVSGWLLEGAQLLIPALSLTVAVAPGRLRVDGFSGELPRTGLILAGGRRSLVGRRLLRCGSRSTMVV